MHLVGNKEWRLTGGLVLGDVGRAIAVGQRLFALGDSIRARLVMLALISTAPLLLLAAVNASQDLTAARQDAQLEALRVAQLHADLIDEHVLSVDTLLRALSTTVAAQPADMAANDELLRRVLKELPPSYTDLFFSPATGQVQPTTGLIIGSSPAAQRPVSARAMYGSGEPPSVATGVVLGRPVIDRDGQVRSVLNVATRLDRLPRLELRDLPAGSVVMILDERGVVLAHSPDYDAWVGRDLSEQAYVQDALQHRLGSGELVSADGVTRFSAFTTATRAPWLVYVGLPSEIVLGSSRVALLRNLWFGVLALGAAVLVAFLLAGRITDPLRRLTADAAALGRGDLTRRAQADGRGETAVLAAVFNQMAEDVERHVSGLAASQQREQEARLAAEAATKQIAVREGRLQDLVRRLQVAQEEERRRVAYEIHDGLAQVAASAHQHLQTFADYHAPESKSGREALGRTVDLVQRTVREARRLIAGLRPTVLDDFGLATAIRLEVEALLAEGWQVTYKEDLGDQRVASHIETALFRVAQEALTNVRKHAGRARVAVTLAQHDDLVRLEVRDWGRGFGVSGPQDRPRPGERVGLLSMHERVALLGGHCTVNSQPGDGTHVIAEVPLRRRGAGGGKDAA